MWRQHATLKSKTFTALQLCHYMSSVKNKKNNADFMAEVNVIHNCTAVQFFFCSGARLKYNPCSITVLSRTQGCGRNERRGEHPESIIFGQRYRPHQGTSFIVYYLFLHSYYIDTYIFSQ